MRAAILARGTIIGPDHLVLGTEAVHGEDFTLASAVSRHVHRALERSRGDEDAAASLLDITSEELRDILAGEEEEEEEEE